MREYVVRYQNHANLKKEEVNDYITLAQTFHGFIFSAHTFKNVQTEVKVAVLQISLPFEHCVLRE